MKKLILTILTCMAISLGLFSQIEDEVDFGFDLLLISNDTAQQIREIDKYKWNIKNNIINFQKIEKIKDSLSYKNIYFKDNVLQLVKVKQIEQGIEKNIEWYFLDNQLIYSEVNWTNIITNKIVNHNKCYLYHEHLIAWVTNENKFMDVKATEFMEYEEKLIAYSKNLIEDAMK